MSDVHERPQGANAADPSTPWKPSNPNRRSMLGLAETQHTKPGMPDDAMVADALAHGLFAPYVDDPVEAIVDGVRIELEGLATGLDVSPLGGTLDLLARRLATAVKLLRWCDNREQMPVEPTDEELEAAPVAPTEPPVDPDDVEVTRDAGPDDGEGDA